MKKDTVMRSAYKVLFLGAKYSVLIPKDFYPNKIDVVDTCDFCVIIRNKDGFSYENVTINNIRNSLKNKDYPKQIELLNAVRRWNEFDFFKENDVYDTCLSSNGKWCVASEYPTSYAISTHCKGVEEMSLPSKEMQHENNRVFNL